MGWGNNSTRKIVNDILELTNPSAANPWDAQAGKDFDKPLEVGTKYFLKVKIKGSVAGSISAGLQNVVETTTSSQSVVSGMAEKSPQPLYPSGFCNPADMLCENHTS